MLPMMALSGWCLMVLSVFMTNHHCVGRRLKQRQSDLPPPSDRTVIIVEFAREIPEDVFIVGGFTNNIPDACADVDPPCSIPIEHTHRFDSTDNYNDWKHGDNFLDWDGAENGQGTADNAEAKGTPMVWIQNASEIHVLGNSNRPLHENSQFWAVELIMDCSLSNGMFEVKVEPMFSETSPEVTKNQMRTLRDREFDPRRLAGFVSMFKFGPNVTPDDKVGAIIPGLEEWFRDVHRDGNSDEATNKKTAQRTARKTRAPKVMRAQTSSSANSWRTHSHKVQKRAVQRILTDGRHRKRMEQFACTGQYPFEAPNKTENGVFVGVCGFANLFLYNTRECEVNGI